MPTWDNDLYLRFKQQRTQPSIDLAQRVDISAPQRVIDLGCGPGNSTAVIRKRWPDAVTMGMDQSLPMLAEARRSQPEIRFVEAEIASWTAQQPFDVVFSNAALQWVGDHATLLPDLMRQVASGGALAVQMPAHYDSALHRVIIEVSHEQQWKERLEPARQSLTRHPPAFYYDLLQPLVKSVDIWETIYYHQLDSHVDIVTWYRGSGMRPYLERLEDEAEREAFEGRVLEGYRAAYPLQADGRVLFPFRRLFFVAYAN